MVWGPLIAAGAGLAGKAIGSAFDKSGANAMQQYKNAQRVWQDVELPNTEWADYSPEQFAYLDDFNPEMANGEQIAEDPLIREAQMNMLAKMAGLADSGLSAEDELGFFRAQQDGAQEAQARQQAALANARARGVSGGGLEFAMAEMGNQAGAARQQEAAMEQAAAAARQRALYTQAYGDQLGSQRSQDFNANSANANILNQFNMANTNAKNQAGTMGWQNRQTVNNQNTQQANDAQLTNLTGRMGANQQNFQNQAAKAAGLANQNIQLGNAYGAQNAANASDRNSLLQAGMSFAGKLVDNGKDS